MQGLIMNYQLTYLEKSLLIVFGVVLILGGLFVTSGPLMDQPLPFKPFTIWFWALIVFVGGIFFIIYGCCLFFEEKISRRMNKLKEELKEIEEEKKKKEGRKYEWHYTG
jgi:hypothetical protein